MTREDRHKLILERIFLENVLPEVFQVGKLRQWLEIDSSRQLAYNLSCSGVLTYISSVLHR